MDYLLKHNANPKPFVWTKPAGKILEKIVRAKQALDSGTLADRPRSGRSRENRWIAEGRALTVCAIEQA